MEENKEVTEDTQEATQPEEVNIEDPKAVLEALERAKKEAIKRRELLAEKEAALAKLQERITALESDEGIAGLKRKIVELQVKSALEKEGIKETDRVVKYLALGDYQLDDEGNVTGFKENLAQVKSDLPELFDPKRRAGGKADLFKNEEVKQKKSGTELQVDRIFGR